MTKKKKPYKTNKEGYIVGYPISEDESKEPELFC
jgi:hypothetical protein